MSWHPMHGIKMPIYQLKMIKVSTASDSLTYEERIKRWKQNEVLEILESNIWQVYSDRYPF